MSEFVQPALKVLVGWDDPSEAETISLLLNIDDNTAEVVLDRAKFEELAANHVWDVVVIALTFPTEDTSLDFFLRVKNSLNGAPVIGAWYQDDIVGLARFISNGLHSHLMRDSDGSYIFLLTSMVAAAFSAAEAQRARLLAEKLRQEVDSVRQLQESVIPRDLPTPAGYNLAARYESSQIRVMGSRPVTMAGGDYYDAFEVDEDALVLLVGDASGHGMKACMSIMTMHTLIRMIRAGKYPKTADFVAEVNRRLATSEIVQDGGGFITLLYSTLNVKTHKLSFTSAGAPIPLLQDLNTNEVRVLGDEDSGGLPLAIEDEWDYEGIEVDVPPNSRLLIYTDGLEEAFPEGDDEHEEFGIDGIAESLRSSAELPLVDALEKLFADSSAHTLGQGRMDDTSVLLIERIR
ncbi:MAG TPA: regulator [Planctomycetaceae bacterium]|nr:regulator [Blastopirellula sp.]HAY79203.1 regulator [Planctomycetaceae bacterium]